ncbi:MAG: hypothetical protein KFF49_07135 [Bacteroidales bacterium]|nr:hypothetical protein [Bacteroidales bacterium]
MPRIRQISLLTGILMSLYSLSSYSQSKPFLKPLRVSRGSYVSINDSLVYFRNDTVIYISDSYMPQDSNVYYRTVVFYDSLKAKAEKTSLTRFLYDLVVIPPEKPGSNRINERNIDNFIDHDGKTIRHILLRRLNAFGSKLDDPEASLEREDKYFLNKTHVKTREAIIKNYLLMQEKDSLDPHKVSESERLLRKLPYIYDARIIIIPVSSTEVDMMVITKDIYSTGLMTDIQSYKVGKVSVFNKNLMGFGHELALDIPYDYDEANSIGYGVSYSVRNISRTMIDLDLVYRNAFNRKTAGINVSRKFLTAYTRYAGGISVNDSYILDDLISTENPEPVELNKFDMWMGRSFLVNEYNFTRLIISGRYIYNNVWNRPEISSSSYYDYQKFKLYLGSLSIVSQRYYKSSLIYNYGRNEDIPYGGLIEVTYGKEYNEFNERDYISLRSAFGSFIPNAGYFYGKSVISTFTKDFSAEQSLFQMQFNYISGLVNMRSHKLRLFGTLDYTRGFNRYDDEFLLIGENNGIRGFKNDSLFPDQRLYLNLEAVAFSNLFIYGFRFAVFGFADMVMFSKDLALFKYDSMVSGFGIGLRVRNENLIFNTFQIRFGIYPGAPPYSMMQYFNITGERLLNPPGFDPGTPAINDYR